MGTSGTPRQIEARANNCARAGAPPGIRVARDRSGETTGQRGVLFATNLPLEVVESVDQAPDDALKRRARIAVGVAWEAFGSLHVAPLHKLKPLAERSRRVECQEMVGSVRK